MEIAMSKASAGSSAAHRSGFTLTDKVLRAFAQALRPRRGARDLFALNDHMLKDLGLTRADVFSLTHGRIAERD
jgi:uncharacterized protein YjiS (DUF1127 family)